MNELVLKTHPTLIHLNATVENKFVNATLRVRYRIPIHSILTILGIPNKPKHDELAHLSNTLLNHPSKFCVTIKGKLYQARHIRFRDGYVDSLCKTVVLTLGFQEADFVRAYSLPKGVRVLNYTVVKDVLSYIRTRTSLSATRKPKTMPKVVLKNLARFD